MSTNFLTRQVSGVTIIVISGRITLGEPSNDMKEAIAAALKGGSTRILINLAEVSYMDSAGIGELLGGLRAAQSHGASIRLLNVSRRVQDLLKLTNVIALFECFDDEASAIAGFYVAGEGTGIRTGPN